MAINVTNDGTLPKRLDIDTLSEGIPVITPEAVGFYKQNCMVCFHQNDHQKGVSLEVIFNDKTYVFIVDWKGEMTPQIISAYQDLRKATDFAACAIALLLIRELTDYIAIEQSIIGTTIDYNLIYKQDENPDLIFNHSARLEVSGILKENDKNTVEGRLKEKQKRLKQIQGIPDLISVTEFSKPRSKMIIV